MARAPFRFTLRFKLVAMMLLLSLGLVTALVLLVPLIPTTLSLRTFDQLDAFLRDLRSVSGYNSVNHIPVERGEPKDADSRTDFRSHAKFHDCGAGDSADSRRCVPSCGGRFPGLRYAGIVHAAGLGV